MGRRSAALSLALVLAFPSVGGTQGAGVPEDLAKGIRLVEQGDLDNAVITLDGAVRRLSAEKGRERDLATAYLYRSMAYMGLGQADEAKADMREAWRNNKDMKLDPERFPPRVIQLYEQTKAEARQASAPPTAAPSAKPATEKKGGGGKGLLIGIGVAAAVGGVVVAIAGGGRSTQVQAPQVPQARVLSFFASDVPQDIRDFSETDSNILVSGATGTLTDIKVNVSISHEFNGDLRVILRHPDGTEVILHDTSDFGEPDIVTQYPTQTLPAQPLTSLNGKGANGTWTLSVQDKSEGSEGRLNAWSMQITVVS